MRELQRYHHFRPTLIEERDYVSRLEALVVEKLTTTSVPDELRDSSIAWELKHQAGVTQMSRLLAAKRGLDPTIAAIGALLHDIYVIDTGSYDDHARRGGPIAESMLSEVGYDDQNGIADIVTMVTHHSDKDEYEDDPYAELGKDVDVLDCLLYPDAVDEYLLTKPFKKVKQYLNRAQAVWNELTVPVPRSFTVLNDFEDNGWLVCGYWSDREQISEIEADATQGVLSFPVLTVHSDVGGAVFTTRNGADYVESRSEGPSSDGELTTLGEAELFWPFLNKQQRIGDIALVHQYIGRGL